MSNPTNPIRDSVYSPPSPLETYYDTDVYPFLFDSPNPNDGPQETNTSVVLTDPMPGSLHDSSNIETEMKWTLPQLRKRVELCGRMLSNKRWGLEVGKGDVVGILGWNGVGFGT